MKTTYDYGTVPPLDDFCAAFDRVCADTGRFEVRNDEFHGNHDFKCVELFDTVTEFAECGPYDDGEALLAWANAVLCVLGFEWV